MPGTVTSTSSRRRTAVLAAATLALAGVVALDAGPGHAAPLSACVSADNSPPVVRDVTFDPAVVDVSSAPAHVTLRLDVTDPGGPGDPTGVSHASAYLSSADGTVQMPVRFERVSGDTWSAGLTLPRHAPAGEWRLAGATVSDHAGNSDEDYFSSSGDRPPFDETLTVASSPSPDREDPVATRVTIRDRRVDTTRGPADVRVVVWATDAGAGVETVAVDAVRGRHLVRAELSDRGDGSFAGDLRIPRWAGTGTWELQWLGVSDGLGYDSRYRHDRLRALGDHAFHVTSRADEAAPTLRSLALRPHRVDVRTTSETVVVVARVADGRSGVRRATAHVGGIDVALEQVGGTPRHGTWRGSVTLTPCTRLLHDRLRASLDVRDAAGNRLRTPVRRIPVRHPDNRAPEFGFTTASVPPGGPVAIAFDEPVNGLDDASAIVVQWDGDARAYGPPLAGAWACFEGDGEDASCADGRVRSATWTPDHPLQPGVIAVELNPDGTLSLTDLSGNPFDHAAASVRVV